MSGRRAGLLLVGLVIAFAYLKPAQLQANPGQQCLSWTASEKNAYVGGFIDGYLTGMTEICRAAGHFLRGETYVSAVIDGRHPRRPPLQASQAEAITPSNIPEKLGWISAFMPTSSLSFTASIRVIAPFHFAS